MNKITTLVLLALVVGLGFLAKAKLASEAAAPQLVPEPLFPHLEMRRLTGLFIDDVERSVHVKLVREGRAWKLTDPLEYPAATESMRLILDPLARAVAMPVPAAEAESLAADFDPPRAILDVIETMEDGEERRTRLELGPLDIDGMSVNVRIRDRYFRTLRNLDTAVKREVNDFRSKKLFEMDPAEIVEIHRAGYHFGAQTSKPLVFDAYRRGTAWQIERPWRAQGDLDTLGVWAAVLSNLSVRSFVRDHEGPLTEFGLEEPQASIELMDRHGDVQKVVFSNHRGTWFFKIDTEPNVYELEAVEVNKCFAAAPDFLDHNFTRAFRGEIDEVLLATDSGELRLTQNKLENTWTVAEKPWGEDVWSVDVPAGQPKIDDLLAMLEQERIAHYQLDGSEVSEHFPSDASKRGFWLTYRGEVQGGRLGALVTTEAGSAVVKYLRDGDQLVAFAPAALDAIAHLELGDLMSFDLFRLDETQLSRLVLRAGGVQREFTRAQQGTWKYTDVDAAATELYPVLDSLFFLRATEHLEAAEATELVEPVTVEITSAAGPHIARIGKTAAGRVEAEVLGARSVLENQELHGKLLEIVRKKGD
ncbi:MAG: DUF4340 domain-containing protein [bacterium]|nr:DUF4340 domain-containing protein [bacterium]